MSDIQKIKIGKQEYTLRDGSVYDVHGDTVGDVLGDEVSADDTIQPCADYFTL